MNNFFEARKGFLPGSAIPNDPGSPASPQGGE